ncbi:MAG: hypothetical protein Q9207_004740 [Kuettlingeria erythrocarpa]
MEKDIAVIGVACRVAGANSPAELWKNLLSSKDVQRRITRFNIGGFYHPAGGPLNGLTNVDRAYMLDDDAIDKFDNAFFHVTQTEAAAMDPQQRMLLEVSYETIENAGIRLENFVGTDTAVFTGMLIDRFRFSRYIVTGTAGCMASNRLSYFYNLSGPSMSVDTACSSSMAALHQAVRTLQHGDSTMALVCGSNLILSPESFVSMTELGFIGPSGRCRSFDAHAEGYGRGEGIGAILLKTLRKAVDDHDPIRAVIKGTRLNQDGRTQGITLPSASAQHRNMQSLYDELGIDPSDIQYLEAHGTGTAAGDPLEMQAVNEVYARNPLTVGSVKSNIGHCEAASALTGLIKTVLCLENAQIPAQMHFGTPNPAIDFSHRTIPTKNLDWPSNNGQPRRAAINTFGAGGTNGHAVVEAYHAPSLDQMPAKRPWLFKVSAADEISLQALSLEYASFIKTQKPSLSDLAHTLLVHRSSLRAQMGRTMIEGSTLFRSTLQECEDVLRDLHDGPSWSLIEELSKAKEESNIDKAEFSQPLCTALQVAIVSLLRSWNLKPDAVVGHSSGEIAAAFTAGMISLRTAMITAYYRGYVLANISTLTSAPNIQGSMCAVGTSEEQCASLIQQWKSQVQLAAVNSPHSCTLSGDSEAIESIVELCGGKGFFCRVLKVDRGKARIEPLATPPYCAMVSSVTGKSLKAEDLTPTYWAQNMTSTVLFNSAVEECVREHPNACGILEVGPHPALKGSIPEILCSLKKELDYFHTCKRDTNDFESILESTGKMHVAGIPLDLRAINAREVYRNGIWRHQYRDVLVDLPSYPWNHSSSFWSESRLSRNTRFRAFPRHELLGSRCGDDIPTRACWRNHLSLDGIGWLQGTATDHLPGTLSAMYLLMATEAACQLSPEHISASSVIRIREMEILNSPTSNQSRHIETRFMSWVAENHTSTTFEVHLLSDSPVDRWTLCSQGSFELSNSQPLPRLGGNPRDLPGDPILLQKAQACYAHIFRDTDQRLRMSSAEVQGSSAESPISWQQYPIQPSFLASLLSLGPTSVLDQGLPVGFRIASIENMYMRVEISDPSTAKFSIETKRTQAGGAESLIDVDGDSGITLAGKVRYEATELLSPGPVTSSLFFKPVPLPDITKPVNADVMSIERVFQLLCHKWPMCDIRIGDVPERAQRRILESLNRQRSLGYGGYRSVFILKALKDSKEDERIRVVEDLGNTLPVHMLFTGQTDSVDAMSSQLNSFGLICIQQDENRLERQSTKTFEYLCDATGLDEYAWSLWRKKAKAASSLQQRPRVIFSPRSFPLMTGRNIPLEQEKTRALATQPGLERFDAIVVDDSARSVITVWPGKVLIPWLQHLMQHADSLLWVSRNAASGPFANVSGTLLRTMQAEQPSLKVYWLVIDEADINDTSVVEKTEEAYISMQRGDNELGLAVDCEGSSITRYLPDGGLSSTAGVSIPRIVQDPLDDRDYALAIAAPKKPVVFSFDSKITASWQFLHPDAAAETPNSPAEKKVDMVQIAVSSSLISSGDLAAYRGNSSKLEDETSQRLGTFFAGRVVGPGSPTFAPESHVVGWIADVAHAKTLLVPESNLYRSDSGDSPRNLAEFASLATAMAVVDGRIRARKEDRLAFTNVKSMLREAFIQVSQQLQVAQLEPVHQTPCAPTFVIEESDSNKVMVDNRPVDIIHYLHTRPPAFEELWGSHKGFTSSWQTFDLKAYEMAFDSADIYSAPTILNHDFNASAMPHVPMYRQPTNLAKTNRPSSNPEDQNDNRTGAYIIIGGLGGLGRYVCSWLIAQGATTLYAISRSGLSTPEAQTLHSHLTSTPTIHFRAIKADACDRPLMSSILTCIRATHSVKGIINMAMILGDAPLASMTAEEWDRALRVKIDSSWILHELTADDDLEHFILFSSIASVLGNRGQGSYNVGNAFLNALAVHRRRQGKVGVSVALGAMTDIGVLADLPNWDPDRTARNLARSGLARLRTPHLAKILEAAFRKGKWQREGRETRAEEALIVTGLEMFEKEVDGRLVGRKERVFWTELPEFSHLSRYRPPAGQAGVQAEAPLKERVESIAAMGGGHALRKLVQEAVLGYLSSSLGFQHSAINPTQPLGSYGLDSLNAVSCQLWCFRELGVDASIKEIYEAKSIEAFVAMVCDRIVDRKVKGVGGEVAGGW